MSTLTVNGICSFWQCNSIWGGHLRSRKLLNVWPWNFYQMLPTMRRHEIKKIFSINGLFCKSWVKSPNTQNQPVSWNPGNFAWLSILTSEVLYRYLKDWLSYIKFHKMAPNAGLIDTKCELGHITSPNLLGEVMSQISRHWTSFKSSWLVELKTALYQGQDREHTLNYFSIKKSVS